MLLQREVDISQHKPRFEDLNGQNVDTGVVNLSSKFELDPTLTNLESLIL